MTRWMVERTKDNFEDVGYAYIHVDASGALIFKKSIWSDVEYIVAAGQWLTVTKDDEGV